MMKQACVVATLALAACGSTSQVELQFDGERALGYIEQQLAFGPRVPNTEGHRRTGDWIRDHLRATADSVEVTEFSHVTGAGDILHLRNFMGRFRPEIDERILFVAHWDTRPVAEKSANMADRRLPVPGANDGGSGVAILLGVADELTVEPPRFGVDLLFVDGEDYGDFAADEDVLIGSRYFAEHVPDGYRPLFGVLFDIVGDRNLRLAKEWNSVNGAPEVVERVWRVAADLGLSQYFLPQVGGAVTDDHLPLLERGIRIIDVIQSPLPPYHHTVDDVIDKVSARSLAIVGTVALALVR